MKSTYLTPFTRSLLTGLFIGIVVTVLCLAFNIFFREKTNYQPASLINVSTLIFAVNIIFVIFGIIHYGFHAFLKKGDIIFAISFILLTAFFAWKADGIAWSVNPVENQEFHQLLMTIVIIMGLSAAIGIPILYHSRKFEEHVL